MITAAEHGILAQCSGNGYGAKPNPFSLIELYGYIGACARRFSIFDSESETRAVLESLAERGLVKQCEHDSWETTKAGDEYYWYGYPPDMNTEALLKDYQAYLLQCDNAEKIATNELIWCWLQYYTMIEQQAEVI
jgi:hypothetical protein